MIDFHSVSIEDVWKALPETVRENPNTLKKLQDSTPQRATADYTDFFWEDNPDAPGRRRRSLPSDQLLSLMMRLYIHLGGEDTETELAFWKKIFNS